MQNNILYCKKTFVTNKILFIKDHVYRYDVEDNKSIFVYYNEKSTKLDGRGYRFYIDIEYKSEHNYKDKFFCSLQEYRKLKLQKLNG